MKPLYITCNSTGGTNYLSRILRHALKTPVLHAEVIILFGRYQANVHAMVLRELDTLRLATTPNITWSIHLMPCDYVEDTLDNYM